MRFLTVAILVVLAIFVATLRAEEVRWHSATTGGEVRGEVTAPATQSEGAVRCREKGIGA